MQKGALERGRIKRKERGASAVTYADFLLLFLIVPILLLTLLLRRRLLERRYWFTTALLFLPVLLCMAPWDHAAVAQGIWNWTPRQTWGIRFWLIPPEEYLFSLLETLLATMSFYALAVWREERTRRQREGQP